MRRFEIGKDHKITHSVEKTQKNVDLHFATRISDPFEQRRAPGVADSEADEHHAHAGADRAARHRPA